jgi:outer membrane protein assembly factor BamB
VNSIRCLILILSVLVLLPLSCRAEDWPHWRGPHLNGSSEAENLPSSWSKTENIKWVAPLPGGSGATPIVLGDRIFLTSLDNRTKSLLAICLDRETGRVLWEKVLGIGGPDKGRGKNMASPSPVTDGNRVFFLYGTGDFAALDLDGNILWQRNLQKDHGKFNILFGYHSSPTFYEGKVYVVVHQRDTSKEEEHRVSFLLAVDPETGKDILKYIRPNQAAEESQESYSTAIPMEWNGRSEILLIGGDCVSGHNPETGAEYWRWGQWNPKKVSHWRVVPSPVFHEGLVYVCAPKKGPVFAVKAGKNGQLEDEGVEWKSEDATSDVCVPLVYENRLYVLNGDRRKDVTCLELKTGKTIWQGELGGDAVYRASLTGADGKIYAINEAGEVVVLRAGDEFEILHRTEMGEELCRSTIAVSDRQLFIRTAENLYCVESPQTTGSH